MIIWINGAFGAGKTTLADELHRRLPDALPFDPEYVGYLLAKWVPAAPTGDFQDLPLWRRLVAAFAVGMAQEYRRPVVVPMTLVNAAYRDEVFGAVRAAGVRLAHVFLEVPADELRRRIDAQVLAPDDADADRSAREFRLANVDRCVAARPELPADTLVLRADRYPPDELADRVLRSL